MPSQKQLRWAQLRVGLTVVFAAVVLAFLVFLMSGTTGLFTPTLRLVSYMDNAGGLRNGAPVRLQSVDIGNVEKYPHCVLTGRRMARARRWRS